MTLQLAYKQLLAGLYTIYSDREAANIADLVIEQVVGLQKIDRIIHKEIVLSPAQQQAIDNILEDLLKHRPVQYVLQHAWFANMKLYVDENVLIPRPETEELVDWVVKDIGNNQPEKPGNLSLLDVGTGSGCIAITLKKQLPVLDITGIDVSNEALDIARKNAVEQRVAIKLLQVNFLVENKRNELPTFDVIVSNPPYIKTSEAALMEANVLQFEPLLALFVPDDDALIFYHAIANFALPHLAANGKIYVEINEALGEAVATLFKENGFANVEVRKDMQGKDRMVSAAK